MPEGPPRRFLRRQENARHSGLFCPTHVCILQPLLIRARYDPSLVAEFNFLRDGNLVPGSKLANSADATLTGLAQLGAYQTGTERAFISLFDANHQYVIAETAPSMRIAPSLANDLSNPLVLCGSAIPRDQGTCDHVLYLPANPDGKDPAELPLSYVPNLVTDPRFSDRPYCQFGEAGQFYAAVPIRTRRGINIGAYCVMSQKRPQGWNDGSPRHLRDVSYAIMDYLEQRRIMSMSRMHERLNRGLGSFIEGKSTLGRWQNQLHHEAFMSASNKREGVLNATQQHLEQQKQDALEEDEAVQRNGRVEEWRGGSTSAEAAHSVDGSASSQKPAVRRSADSFATGKGFSPAAKDPDAVEDEPKRVFSRAANIIREAFEVEGCVFMDVAIGAYTLPPDSESSESADHVSATSSGEESAAVNQTTAPMCDVLGFSTTDTSSINGDGAINIDESIVHHIGKLPSRFLAALLRRYPDGKIFNFDAIGELQQTESSEEDTASVGPPNSDPTEQEQPEKLHGPFSRKREGEVIHQAFPSARSVAFIPMRDLKRDRWLAGGFVYTLDPTRVISAEGELSFLRAFEKAITSELLKLETRRIERARSDALGSLSHELRSPLHGVILGTELLNDTELSGFQGNTTHMIETCGRTLLDTIDHLLDYSKVNSFERNSRKESSTHLSGPPSLRKRTMSSQFGKKLYANIRLDGVIEEVAQGVFAGFSFQYKSIQQLSSPGSISTDLTAQKQLDGMQAMEQLSPTQNTDKGQECFQFGLVSVYLCIDPTSNWAFYMQPGAIRRIFMNLFGNSLKYTTSGYIRVSLTQEPHNARRSTSEKLVQLTVQDTGKGMGQDFMRHRLFKPFSQEDELTPGTGLGLSLVKTMVSQLGGRINVQSQRGVGTTITVRLPLEQSSQTRDMPNSVTEGDEEFEEQLRELKGLRVRICGFEGAHDDERGIVEGICRDWLKMEVVADSGNAPDVILRSSSALPANFEMTAQLATTPNVVVCRDALAAYQQLKKYESIEQDGVLEFISQP